MHHNLHDKSFCGVFSFWAAPPLLAVANSIQWGLAFYVNLCAFFWLFKFLKGASFAIWRIFIIICTCVVCVWVCTCMCVSVCDWMSSSVALYFIYWGNLQDPEILLPALHGDPVVGLHRTVCLPGFYWTQVLCWSTKVLWTRSHLVSPVTDAFFMILLCICILFSLFVSGFLVCFSWWLIIVLFIYIKDISILIKHSSF